jgi:hypothetical protein
VGECGSTAAHINGENMQSSGTFRRLVVTSLAIVSAGCNEPTPPVSLSAEGGVANAAGGGTTLLFNGTNANVSGPLGFRVTNQIDDIGVEATVRWDGPNAAANHQMIYYNGHGCCSGWGIIVIGGQVGILAGGITIPMTPFSVTDGAWHHIRAERVGGVVTVRFDDLEHVIGSLPVNPVNGVISHLERTSIGGDGTFSAPTGNWNGAIDNVKVRNLATDTWIERWNFNKGEGTTAVGVNGTVLGIGNAVWARRGGN